MSRVCIPLSRSGPANNRMSYDNVVFEHYDMLDKPKPCAYPHAKISQAYTAHLDEETREWFEQHGINYKVGYNTLVGVFVRVHKRWAVMTKLTWG